MRRSDITPLPVYDVEVLRSGHDSLIMFEGRGEEVQVRMLQQLHVASLAKAITKSYFDES